MSDMVDVVFKHLKVVKHLILRNYWRTIDLIDKVQGPVMFIKCKP